MFALELRTFVKPSCALPLEPLALFFTNAAEPSRVVKTRRLLGFRLRAVHLQWPGELRVSNYL